jgi:hypothetical protein
LFLDWRFAGTSLRKNEFPGVPAKAITGNPPSSWKEVIHVRL